jgi:hypothetical protein
MHGPEVANKVVAAFMGTPGAKDFNRFFTKQGKELLGVDKPSILKSGIPIPNTVTRAIEDAGAEGFKSPTDAKSYLAIPKMVADPQQPDSIKVQAIKKSFGPGNEKLINKFSTEEQMYIFSDITSKEATKEVYRLAAKDPELGRIYTNWVNSSFDRLFKREVMGLTSIKSNPFVQVRWDSDNKSLKVERINPNLPEASQYFLRNENAVQNAERTVRRLNMGLDSFKNMATATGQNTEAVVMKALVNNGANIKGTIVEDMLHSILGSQKPKPASKSDLDQANPQANMAPLPAARKPVPDNSNYRVPPSVYEQAIRERTPDNFRARVAPLEFADEQLPSSGSLGDFLRNPSAPGLVGSPQRRNSGVPARVVPGRGKNASAGSGRGNLSDETEIGREVIEVPEGADINPYLRRK